jgi:putative transferase (TIGR04331 family)
MFINYDSQKPDVGRRLEVDLSLEGLAKCVMGDFSAHHFDMAFDYLECVGDLDYIREKNSQYFPLLVEQLNKYLHADLDVRAWHVLIGHWYLSFSKVIFHRVSIIRVVADSPNFSSIDILDDSNQELSSLESDDLTNQCLSYEWNEKIFLKILEFTNLVPRENVHSLSVEKLLDYKGPIKRNNFGHKEKSFWGKFIFRVIKFYGIFASQLSAPVFYYTQMPVWEHLKLFLLSGGLPTLAPVLDKNELAESTDLRRTLSLSMVNVCSSSESCKNSFERVLTRMFFLCIPRNFLEGFYDNETQASSKMYPQNPKYIFLCNGFGLDGLSFYLARQISLGTPYLVGQHGGHYGLSKIEMNTTVEEQTADIFFTWGHTNSVAQNVVRAFNWKKKLKVQNNGNENNIIIVTRPPFPSIEHYSVSGWYKGYVDGVVELVKSLDKRLYTNVILRIHPSGAPVLERSIWERELPGISIDDSKRFNINCVGKNGILVCTYMSTLFYEVLNSSNIIPICGIWNDIRKDTVISHRETMETMHGAKILFDSTADAADHISSVYGATSVWWSNPDQRHAVHVFNRNLNRTSDPRNLAKNLLNVISENLGF